MAKASTRLVRKAQRELIEPEIVALGFTGKYPDWRREHEGETHFLQFYTRKYGGGFSFSGAYARNAAPHWDIAHTDFDDRASAVRTAALCKPDGGMALFSLGDFEYAHIADDAEACRALVAEAAAVLPQMDHWLKTRTPGPNISTRGHRLRDGLSKQFRWHLAMAQVDRFSLTNRRPDMPHLNADADRGIVDYPLP